VRAHRLIAACLLVLSMAPGVSRAVDTEEALSTLGLEPAPDAPAWGFTPTPDPDAVPPSIDASAPEAGADDDPKPRRRLIKWNEFEGPITTFRFGFGLLVDSAAYLQDHESGQQVGTLLDDMGVRDSRLVFSGRFQTKRPLSWTFSYMYDSADHSWLVRLSGIQIGFPELNGSLFIGRTKEGFSMLKVMTGYHPWTMERSPGADAFVPILADGAKWMGYFPRQRVFFSLGGFGDEISEDETFASYDYQAAARIGWLPIGSVEDKTVWHVAVMGRGGRPDEGKITLRSKPEDTLAPYFVETPTIASDAAGTAGFETYYRKGPWLVGGELDYEIVDPNAGRTLGFFAGDVVATWILTGETRGYSAQHGYFLPVSPDRTVFSGGPGAWEAVFHMSYIDLDNRDINGGKLFRLTSMMNWYLSDNVRFEFVYGYGILDRFDLDGHTHFFQSRIQLTL
jgi:phosphate-selective porin OprO and OprP